MAELRKTLKVCEGVTSLHCAGDSLYVGSVDDSIQMLDIDLTQKIRAKMPMGTISLKANHEVLAVNSFENTLRVFDRDSLVELATIEEKPCETWRVEFSQTRPVIFTGGQNGQLKGYSYATGEQVLGLRVFAESHFVTALRMGIDDRLFVGTSGGSIARISGDFSEKQEIKGNFTKAIKALAFGPDPSKLLVGGDDCRVHLLDLEKEKVLSSRPFEGHSDFVTDVLAFPDRQLFVSSSTDCTAKLWDPRDGRARDLLPDRQRRVWSLAFFEREKILALGCDSGEISLLSIQ